VSRNTLTKAQERELVALYQRKGGRVRPLTLRKFRLLGLLDGQGRLNDEGVIRARALEHEQQLEEGELA